ncbi:MAG: hypothetical protein DMG65_11735 [Candidatus Angelobacter sp. Gp1-AA117]|nr:MAG: hypothetical protein DMG65_11735 [Candidatus Angelobacter sp. Gp1-AA117]
MDDRSGTNGMNDDQGSSNMVRVFGQLLMLPIAALVYGMDMLIKTMQEMQKVTNQGMQVVTGPGVRPETSAEAQTNSANTYATANATQNEEEKLLSYDNNNGNGLDKNLRDDMLKLVRYKILFVKREYEHAFPEQEDLVYDNMDGNAFTAWKVAEFIQELAKVKDETTAEGRAAVGIRLPHKWKHYPGEKYTFQGYLTGFPPEDKKYLRVFYQVLERYPREKFRHDERQIEVLEEIRDKIGAKPASARED